MRLSWALRINVQLMTVSHAPELSLRATYTMIHRNRRQMRLAPFLTRCKQQHSLEATTSVASISSGVRKQQNDAREIVSCNLLRFSLFSRKIDLILFAD